MNLIKGLRGSKLDIMMNKNFRYYFLVGLFSILPIAATLWLIRVILTFFAGPAKSIIGNILPSVFPGQEIISWIVGFIMTIIFVLTCGYIISSVFGKMLFSKIENIIGRIPIAVSYTHLTLPTTPYV